MTELELKQLLSKITRPDETARTAAHAHWASLAKPLGGLGRLETLLEDAAALTGTAELAFSRRAVLVLCADNGVALAAKKPVGGAEWRCGFVNEHFYAGFPHLYWAGTALPRRFVDAAAHYHQEEQDQ